MAADQNTPEPSTSQIQFKILQEEEKQLLEFQEKTGKDVVLHQMQLAVRDDRVAIEYAKEICNRAVQPDEKMRALQQLAKLQKGHMENLKTLAAYQEKITHTDFKKKKKNKSAAPGQQVGIAVVPSTKQDQSCEQKQAS